MKHCLTATIGVDISSYLGSAINQVREVASHPELLMSLNLSRNAVAMEKALSHLADAERALEDCSSCLVRDVIVSEAQAAEHNRSIVNAKNALLALRGQIRREHEEVCRHLQDAQLRFLQSKPLISLATGYTGCVDIPERELDLSTLVYRLFESNNASSQASVDLAGETQTTHRPRAAASSSSQLMVVRSEAGNIEDTGEGNRQVNSSLELALLDDDDDATVKEASDDGHSYAGTIVRGRLRGDSE